jgi:heme-binding NEAT domain protein
MTVYRFGESRGRAATNARQSSSPENTQRTTNNTPQTQTSLNLNGTRNPKALIKCMGRSPSIGPVHTTFIIEIYNGTITRH